MKILILDFSSCNETGCHHLHSHAGGVSAAIFESERSSEAAAIHFRAANSKQLAEPCAVLIDRLTYSEALSIAQTGVELLHEHAIRLLSTSGLMTVIRNTLDTSGEVGSVVG